MRIATQIDDTTCGITCLQAVYSFYEKEEKVPNIDKLNQEVAFLKEGGTLDVMLGNHALSRGYSATIYTYNLQIFDPTWFQKGVDLAAKLQAQVAVKSHRSKIVQATPEYLKFLKMGGKIRYQNLSASLLRSIFNRQQPIITGLSFTYLNSAMRERAPSPDIVIDDDVGGEPSGHFVVLSGYNEKGRIIVKDPYPLRHGMKNNTYTVSVGRLLNSIMLGIVTFDANLLVIQK
ncbi:MAG: C39 family peptidase [Leptonema sp. (in: Bacteria)]|nr:C39 family peptidase [Leptonema sp. (in: bacteria)]